MAKNSGNILPSDYHTTEQDLQFP